jgi:type I restriction enzyme S subunit
LKLVPLGEVCTLEYGKPLEKEFRNSDGAFKAYGANGPISSAIKYLIEGPCIIVGRKGSAGEITYVEENVWPLDVTYYIKHDPKESNLRYLFYVLKSLDIKQFVRGVKPGLNRNDVYQLLIPRPSLVKQREIVEKLDRAFSEIDLLEGNLGRIEEKINQLSLSIMGSVFTPSDFGAQSNDLSRDEGSDMKNWTQATLGDVFASITNGVNCDQKSDAGKHSVTRIETISKGVVNFDRIGHADLSERDLIKYRLHRNDILFSHINSPIHVGKTAIFDSDYEIYHGVNLLRIRTVEAVNPKFLKYFLLQLFISGYWLRVAKQSVNQASVNQKDISTVLFSYPPLDKQFEIVEKLDSAFTEIELLKEKIKMEKDHAAALRQSLLSSAFSQEEVAA